MYLVRQVVRERSLVNESGHFVAGLERRLYRYRANVACSAKNNDFQRHIKNLLRGEGSDTVM